MRRCILYVLYTAASILCTKAQLLKIDTYDLQPLSLHQPMLIGKAGNCFMLYDIPEPKGIPLFILDSNLQLLTKVYLPNDAYAGKMRIVNGALRVSWYTSIPGSNGKTAVSEMKMIQVNKDGEVHTIENNSVKQFMQSSGQLPLFASDKFQNRELTYVFRVDSMRVFLNGFLPTNLNSTQNKVSNPLSNWTAGEMFILLS